mmetsp:Transcript_11608/g.14993  ORF Transcript_11608/g.14993 Transcript_11608/m.14993 type:complete len:221 (-) Transcript_11608:345-1007(-)
MLAPALRRHRGDGALHQLQKRLLHALARHVAGDRGVFRLAGDLVDLVDIDDAALRAFNIVVRRLEQLQDDVLHILTDIPCFGQSRCVGHCERHVQNARERLREQCLTAPRWADQHYVRFCELDAISAAWICQSLIVVVNRHREDAFRVSLPDDIIIKNIADFLRRRHAFFRFKSGGFVFLTDDIHTELNAFITDEDGWTRNQLFDFVLALPAERAIKRIL